MGFVQLENGNNWASKSWRCLLVLTTGTAHRKGLQGNPPPSPLFCKNKKKI